MSATKLTKHSLFRCVYRIDSPDDSECKFVVGHRMTVVADSLEEAVERVQRHEAKCGEVTFTEVVRETIEVWS